VCNCAIIKTPLPHLERSSNKAERSRAKGREKQAHGMTAPNKTLLSIMDKPFISDSHNTQKEIGTEVIHNLGPIGPVLPQTER
jgi:hypothetical protein